MKPTLLLISICLQAALFDVIGAAPQQQQLCPNGKKNGDVWDENKGKFGFRKHCTVDEVNGGYCVQVLGCLTEKGEFIKRGEERIGANDAGCPLVQRCKVNGTTTTFEWNYNCTVTGKPATAPPLPTATTKKEAAKTTADAILTGRPVEQFCPNGKRNGEEWDEMKGSFGFRKHCTTDEVNGGYCVKVLGCIGYKGSFIKRGEELTEYWDEQCNIIQMCKITGDKGLTTEYETSYDCTRTRKPLSSPATDKPTQKITEKSTVKPTKPTDKLTTVKPTTEQTTAKSAKPNEKTTKIQVPNTPVTLPPVECPKGKREGDEWTEKTNGGSHGFRKRCEGGCIVVIGCISQKGTFVKRGQNLTEIWDERCNVITACIATDKTSTRVMDNQICTKETLIPRTTGKTTEKPTKPTEKTTEKTTEKPANPTDRFTDKPTKETPVTGKPVTLPPVECPKGKKEGDEWTEKTNGGSHGFRKRCENGCIIVIGCISQKGSFVKRGQNLTEIWDERCDVITACIATDKTSTRVSDNQICTNETLIPRTTGKTTEKPTTPTERTTEKSANPTDRFTDKPTKETPVTGKPVTLPPVECPKGKKEGEEWDEKTNGGSHGFRKRCEDGCIIVIGCISQKGSFVKRGQNLTEIWDKDCDVVTACIATDKTSTRVSDNLICTNETLIPRTTGKTTEKPTKPTEKSTEQSTVKPTTEKTTVKPTKPTEKTTETPANPSDRFTDKPYKPTEKSTEKPTKSTENPTDKPTKSTERPTKPGKPTDEPIFTIKPITDAPLACDNGKKNDEEWNEKNAAGMEFRKKCVDGCILIIGCISQMGTFVPRGKNHTEYWKPNCDLITACIAVGTNTTRYHWDDRCNGNTVFTRGPPTEKPSSPKGDTPVTGRPSRLTEKPTDKPTTHTYSEKPGSDRCPGGKKAGEVWEESRFVKKCEVVEGQGHCVKIVGCLSAKNRAHMEKGENKTETYAGGCTRITYCLDYGKNTTVVDGDLICPTPSTPARETEAPFTDRPTRGPLYCQNGKKVGVTWIEDDFVNFCTTDGEGKICIKKIACITPLGHQIKRGESYVEQDGKRSVKYECVADGETTLFIQRNK